MILPEVALKLVLICPARNSGRWRPTPDAAISRATIGPQHGVVGAGDQLRLVQLVLCLRLLIGRQPDIRPGVVIGLQDPERSIAVDGLFSRFAHGITGHINGNELVFVVPVVPLSGFMGGQTGTDSPVPSITSPRCCDSHHLPVGIRTEPGGAISRLS